MIRHLHLILLPAFVLSLGACAGTQSSKLAALQAGQIETRRAALAQALADAERASAGGLKTAADQQLYNTATGRAVSLWMALGDDASRRKNIALAGTDHSWQLRASWPENLLFDELIPTETIKTRYLKRRVTRDGVGATFLAHWRFTKERKAQEPFMTQAGYVVTATATLEFRSGGAGTRAAVLMLHDPRAQEAVVLSGSRHPLAADLSATGEYVLTQKAGQMSALSALLHSDRHLDKIGIIALEHPAKDRIPVIFVHGLASRPSTWQNVFNELGADPVIQKNYQLYFFRYPSGVPVLYSAKEFRGQLKELHDTLEREGSRKTSHHMVLIGHSMGGLISKSQIQQSGDRYWVNIFGDKPERAGLSPREIDTLRQYLEFNPNPYVDRVIFVATPHRGSSLATGRVGAIARRLVSAPGRLLGNSLDILHGQAPQNPMLVRLFKNGIPNSVDNLSPTSLFVKTSTTIPLRPGVHVHSIVGNKDAISLTDPRCSDGIVPYTSAHLDGVESELVVHSGHSAHETAEAVAELKRILKVHVSELR